MIPEAAVEAAALKLAILNSDDGDQLTDHEWARAILEAAAPIMRQAFFLEMNLRAVQDELNTPLQLGRATSKNGGRNE